MRNRDDLGQTVEDLMCKMCCPVYVPPPPLNDNASSPICPCPFWASGPQRTSTATRHSTKSSFATDALRFQEACQVIECFEELEQDRCEILRHMKVYGDWDSVLYQLRLMTRPSPRRRGSARCTTSGEARFREGHQGEDVARLSRSRQGQLGCSSGKRCGATDSLRRTDPGLQARRLAWASEVPEHDSLADDFIKPFCDMEGAPVCSRKLKGARDFILRLCWWQQAITLPV